MNNKLFLVCPFSCMENFIRQKYGADVFFLTAMAGIFQWDNKEWVEKIKYFISSEKINEIFILSDVSCRFINAAINNEKINGFIAEIIIQKLLHNNYDIVSENRIIHEQQIKLAELIVNHQAIKIMDVMGLQQEIIQNNIVVHELITSKNANQILQLTITK